METSVNFSAGCSDFFFWCFVTNYYLCKLAMRPYCQYMCIYAWKNMNKRTDTMVTSSPLFLFSLSYRLPSPTRRFPSNYKQRRWKRSCMQMHAGKRERPTYNEIYKYETLYDGEARYIFTRNRNSRL